MGAQLLIAAGEVLLGITIEIAERRRQAVAAVLLWYPTQPPQRVLQAASATKLSPPSTT